MAFKCFWIEPTGHAHESCMVWCSECDQRTDRYLGLVEYEDHDTPRTQWEQMDWPRECDHCDHVFDLSDTGSDSRSSTRSPAYRSAEGQCASLRQWGVGAMWDASWYPKSMAGPDGRCIVVRLPGNHDWLIDSKASNCDRETPHQCWCRHGEPPELTVDKQCDTCTAGGGSIWVNQGHPSEWHGFLRNGWLVEVNEAVPA